MKNKNIILIALVIAFLVGIFSIKKVFNSDSSNPFFLIVTAFFIFIAFIFYMIVFEKVVSYSYNFKHGTISELIKHTLIHIFIYIVYAVIISSFLYLIEFSFLNLDSKNSQDLMLIFGFIMLLFLRKSKKFLELKPYYDIIFDLALISISIGPIGVLIGSANLPFVAEYSVYGFKIILYGILFSILDLIIEPYNKK